METKSNYQRQLAQSLIRSVGVEEAVYFALQNQWMGVLAHLPKDAPWPPARQAAPGKRVVTGAIGSQVS